MRSPQTALEAARNRLRILGLTDEANRHVPGKGPASIRKPPSSRRSRGTVVQRKVGPGQYVNAGASDPVFVIGDLSTRLADGLRPRDRCAERRGRAGDRRSTCWRCPGATADGAHRLRRRGDRSGDAPAAGPRHDRQQGRPAEAGDVRQRHDLFGAAIIRRSACRSRR